MAEDFKRPVLRPNTAAAAAKSVKRVSGGTIAAVALVLLIIAVGAAVYFDLGGAKQAVAAALGFTAEAPQQDAGESASAAPDAQTDKLTRERAALKEREGKLAVRERELDAREQELTAREAAVTTAESAAAQEEQAAAELKAAAEIFAKMEPKNAAKAIAGLASPEDMVRILSVMPRERAALIMVEMESRLATKILSAMMK